MCESSTCELSKMQKLRLSLHLLWLAIFQPYHLPLPFPPPVSNSSCLFIRCQPLLYCTSILFKAVYSKIKNVFIIFCLFVYVLVMCNGEGNGNPLQCSCLENPRDGGAWWAAICGVAQRQTRMKRHSSSSCSMCKVL